MKWIKWSMYYLYVPVVLLIGVRTIKWENLTASNNPI